MLGAQTQLRAAALSRPAAARPAARATLRAAPRRDVAVCARVAGVDIPNNKRVEVALTYVYGVGPTKAKDILAVTGVENKRVRELSEDELTLLRNELADTDKHMLEGDLRRVRLGNVKRLIDTQCYRGKRHQNNLPCRGQKTKTNARQRKGKKVAIAGKKKAPTAR